MTLRDQIILEGYNFKENRSYFHHDNLTMDEYNNVRNYPPPYIFKTSKILKMCGIDTVIELGSCRFAFTKNCIESNYTLPCCQDGQSTLLWNREGFNVHTVDINPGLKEGIINAFRALEEPFPEGRMHIHIPMDGIEFLKQYSKPISFLFLDAWDKGTHEYAENHLRAFKAAEPKLTALNLILIDDTDFTTDQGGKDKLLTPYLIQKGYEIVFQGRQTLFLKT